MEDLRADWKAIRAKGKRSKNRKHVEVPDLLHEDWLAVKGGRHPPYAYIVKWEYPTAIIVWKMAVMGKCRNKHGTFYRVRCAGLLYKSPGLKVYRMDRPGPDRYERAQLCFTREEVERSIEGHRSWHIETGGRQMKRLGAMMEEVLQHMKGMEEYLARLAEDPVPPRVMMRIPAKLSKTLSEPET